MSPRKRSGADGELEFGVQPEKMADYGAFAGAGRG